MLLMAQALVERGMLDSMIIGVERAFMQLEYWIGTGNGKWALGGLVVALAVIVLRSRR